MTVVRRATAADAGAVAAAYNEGIADKLATFETEPRDAAAMAARIARTVAPHAFLVGEVDGAVLGWAATYAYSDRPCYAGVAEFSVYVARAARGAGLGRALLAALLDRAAAAGLHKATGRVFVANTASRALCAALGFREVGVHLRHARLDGEWRDVVTVERLLGPAGDPT